VTRRRLGRGLNTVDYSGSGWEPRFHPAVCTKHVGSVSCSLGIAEIVVRGTLMYLGLFVILRFMARRQAGHFGPADLLVIVLIADAAQNGRGKKYQSVTEAPSWSRLSWPGSILSIG
jgi:hypothetical protein